MQEEDYYESSIDFKEPWEYIEGEELDTTTNDYREASLHFVRIMSISLSYILNASDTLAAAYGTAYALGLGEAVGGRSMIQTGKDLGLSTGTISHHTKQVRLITGLPPSSLMLNLDQVNNHRESIINKLEEE